MDISICYTQPTRLIPVDLVDSEVTNLCPTQNNTAIEAFIYFQKSDDK